MALFQRHQLQQEGDSYNLILYLDPSMTEFADDLGNNKDGAKEKLESSVKSYIKDKFPNLKVKAAKIMLGSMMVATIPLGAMTAQAADAPTNVTTISAPIAANQAQLPDVQGTKYEQPVNMLTTIGVIAGKDDGQYHATDKLSRAEFAKFAVYAAGYGSEAEGQTTPDTGFGDVRGDYWGAKYIKTAKDHGLMQGIGENKFNPLGDISYEEIITVLQRVQGYNDENLSGDWPANHMSIANESGITSGTDYAERKAFNRGDMAVLMKNALLQPVVSYDAESGDFVAGAQTLFAQVFGDRFALDESGNVISKDAEANIEAAGINAVTALTNGKVKISLDKAITAAPNTGAFTITDKDGKTLGVTGTQLGADGKSVVLSTDAQTPYTLYTLKVGNYTKNFVGIPVDTEKPTVQTVVTTANTEVKITFSEAVDPATALDLTNYQIDKDLTATGARLDSTGKIVYLTTSPQTAGTVYKMTVQNVTDYSGNKMDQIQPVFGGMAKDTIKPTASAVVTGNKSVVVTFSEAVDSATAQNPANYSIDGLTVTAATLETDDTSPDYLKKVYLTTSEQTAGTIYKLTINNVTDLAGNVMDEAKPVFGGMAKDTLKPSAPTITVSSNNKVTVKFTEKMDKATAENIANYTVDNNLSITSASLNKAGDTITLTTTDQTPGTVYKVTVKNLADVSGNVMDAADTYFGGMAKDTQAPTAVVSSSASTVTVSFSEPVDPETATNLANYVFDGGLGYPIKAELDNVTGQVVTLTTAGQTPGKIYNVTINGVTDQSGNVIQSNTKKSFVGVGQVATTNYSAQAIGTVNNNTLDVYFDKELTEAQATGLGITVTDEAGNAVTLPTKHATLLPDNKTVRLQFGDIGEATKNPDLFKSGKVYTATFTGANLNTANNAAVKQFAGTSTVNEDPIVTTATALNNTAVKVTFSEPVKAAAVNDFIGSFKINNGAVAVTGTNVEAGAKVTEAVLYLGSPLTEGTIYDMTFAAGITDAAGLNGIKTADYKVNFAGIGQVNQAPKMQAVVPVDKHTFKIIYSEPVNATAATSTYTLKQAATTLDLSDADISLSDDKTTVTVKINVAKTGLESGKIYDLTLNNPSNVKDQQNAPYDTTAGADKVQFGGVDTVNAAPEIVAVDAGGTSVVIAFSEPITVDAMADLKALFDVSVDGSPVTPSAADLSTDGKTVTLTVAELTSGKTGTVKINATGATNILDENKQAPKTDSVSFGTR